MGRACSRNGRRTECLKNTTAPVHGAMGCSQSSFMLVWRYHQLMSGFLANDHLPRVSRQSPLSVNDKDANEMRPGTVHRSHGIHLTAADNLS